MAAELRPVPGRVQPARRIAIIGAGYAGLACAVELARRGISVTVFERSLVLGGRARGVHKDGREFDNGQHILIGAYSELARLMRLTGCSPKQLLRLPLTLHIPGQLIMWAAPLPAPFHLAVGVLMAQGLSWAERLAMLRLMRWLKRHHFQVPEGITVDGLLELTAQPAGLCERIWRPLCVAALNTPGAEACAQVFANVLRDSIAAHAEASAFLLPRVNLSELFPVPAARFLAIRHGRLHTGNTITGISVEEEGFRLAGDGQGQVWDQVVIATAPYHAAPLLAAVPACTALAGRIQVMAHEPILSLYLDYGRAGLLPAPMIGLVDGPVQWAFDRGQITGQESDSGVIACVISASGAYSSMPQDALLASVHTQLEKALGCSLPAVRWAQVITEKRATFACRPGVFRPAMRTPVPGLWLAGDYVDSAYPATLEAAVRSGVACARAMMQVCGAAD